MRNIIIQLVLVVVLGYAAFAVGSCTTKTEFERFTEEYKQVLNDRDRITKQALALEQQAKTLADSAQQLQDTIGRWKGVVAAQNAERSKLKGNLDSLNVQLAAAKDTATMVITLKAINLNLTQQLAVADSTTKATQNMFVNSEKQVAFFRRSYELSDQRGDSLQKVLDNLPKPPQDPDKWIFGLPKPTRTQVAIVAAAAGAYGGYTLKEALSNQR
jgi:ABC-type transporter Mla subunit MlaD